MENQFQLIDTIIKSRLLSFSDGGYEDLLEMDVDSFRKRYKDASDEKLKSIMAKFSEAFDGFDAFSPKYMIDSYIKASDVFNSIDFDWGKNKHASLRKKFCLWMFRRAYINNADLHNDTYSADKEDWALLKLFKPDPEDSRENIDIVFTLLLAFQVIRPFCSGSTRALKYGSPEDAHEKMIELLELLQENLPAFGVFKTLHSIEYALNVLKEPSDYEYPLPPAALWGMLKNISCDLEVNSSPAELSDSHVELNGYVMKGIWVDNARNNQNRFWVFPNNKLMAFCFFLKNNEWILAPYEFAFSKLDYEFEFTGTCVLITTRGNMQVFTNGKLEDEELVRLEYQLDDHDEYGDFQTIRFKLESGSDYPYWMNWNSFKRLPKDHQLAKEYTTVIDKIYKESEMLRCFDYRNIGRWLTDSPDCLVGLDSDFLYLSDIALEKDGYLERINDGEEYPLYEYYIRYAKENQGLNLFSLEISEKQPLYVVPRNPLFYEDLDKKLNAKSLVKEIPNRVERRDFVIRYEDFKESVISTDFPDQLTIYKNLPNKAPDLLCFNKISRIFVIDEIIKWFGVRKFSSREAMMNSDIFRWRQRLS